MVSTTRWLITSYSCIIKAATITVVSSTDRPVHLTLYYAYADQYIHVHPQAKRGVAMLCDPQYTPLTYRQISQVEAGDTLQHTFSFPVSPTDKPGLLHFQGTISGQPSPSTSPTFLLAYCPYYSPPIISSKDTYLQQSLPDTNTGGVIVLFLRDLPTTIIRAIISFDLSTIPSSSTILQAKLELFNDARFFASPTGKIIWLYKCTRPTWAEYQATWNIYATGGPWTAPGGDYVTINPPGASLVCPPAFGWMEWNVKEIIQDAINNSINAHFLAKFENEAQPPPNFSVISFRSRDYAADPTLRPKLTVTYQP